MSRRASRHLFTTLSTALLGAAVSGGCALVYNFDYSGSTSSGAGGGSSSASGTNSSGTNSASSEASSSSGCPMDAGGGGAGGGGGGPKPLWHIRFGGTGKDLAGHPALDFGQNGEIFITGVFTNDIDLPDKPLSQTGTNSFLAMLETNGTQDGVVGMWSTVLGDSADTVSSLVATPDGVIVAGSFTSMAMLTCPGLPAPSAGGHDIFLAKFDTKGTCLWGRVYGDAKEQYANAVDVDVAGDIYLAGSFTGTLAMGMPTCAAVASGSGENAFVAQLDTNGLCKWVKSFGGDAKGLSLAPIGKTADLSMMPPTPPQPKGIAVGGMFTGTIALSSTIMSATSVPYLATFDPAGMPIALTKFAGTNINLVEENAYASDALFGVSAPGVQGIRLGKVDQDGKILSPMQISGTAAATLESITRLSTGDIFLSGSYACGSLNLGKPIPNHGAQDVFVAHLSKMSAVVSGAGYGNAAPQFGRNVRSDVGGNVYVFGDFQDQIDLGLGPLQSAGNSDMFLVMFKFPSIP